MTWNNNVKEERSLCDGVNFFPFSFSSVYHNMPTLQCSSKIKANKKFWKFLYWYCLSPKSIYNVVKILGMKFLGDLNFRRVSKSSLCNQSVGQLVGSWSGGSNKLQGFHHEGAINCLGFASDWPIDFTRKNLFPFLLILIPSYLKYSKI